MLLVNKKDLLRCLRLESKTSNNLIESIQEEAKDMMKRARDILSEANRRTNESDLLKDDIEISRMHFWWSGWILGSRGETSRSGVPASRRKQHP
jgi:hypothetical protein